MVMQAVDDYCAQLRRRLIKGSLPCAKKTAEIMRMLITSQRHADAAALIDDVRAIGDKIQNAKPVELSIGNIVRRVLHIIREEAKNEQEADLLPGGGRVLSEIVRADPVKQQAGLLSQQLRGPSAALRFPLPRGMSLSNLLDVSLDDLSDQPGSTATTGTAAPAATASSVATSANPSPQSQQQQQQAGQPTSISSAASPQLPPGQERRTSGGGNQPLQSSSGSGGPHVSHGSHGGSEADPEGPAHGKGLKKAKHTVQWRGKQEVIDSINELIDELDSIQMAIAASGVEYIHANEVILTFGMSDTTFYFLKEASKKREFQVIVAEGAPRYDGHLMARKLSDADIQATVIPDSAVFAMMARANKVLVGAHAVLADGGVIAPSGIHLVALAAHKHSIPFVVLVGLHKLSPLFPHDPDLVYNDFTSPADVIDFDVLAEGFFQQLPHPSQSLPDLAKPSLSTSGTANTTISGNPTSTPTASTGGSSAHTLGPSSGSSNTPHAATAAAAAAAAAAAGSAPAPLLHGGNVHVPNPTYDFIPPALISLFVTDMGGHTPSYVYRLLTEYYSREDYVLSKDGLAASAR